MTTSEKPDHCANRGSSTATELPLPRPVAGSRDHSGLDGAGVRRIAVRRRAGAQRGAAGLRGRQLDRTALGYRCAIAVSAAIHIEEKLRRAFRGGFALSAGGGSGAHRLAGLAAAGGDELPGILIMKLTPVASGTAVAAAWPRPRG